MSKSEIAKRYILFIISLFFAALGVAFTKHGELGVSPISSVANVMSYKFPSLSLGTWLIIWNYILIVGQIPLSFVFGWFTDLGMWLMSFIPVNSYPMRIIMVVIGIIILGFGISLSVIADVIMNSGEAFVKAVSDTLSKDFGNVKIAFDVLYVIISIVLSLLFFDFTVVGTREGTIISALLTGIVVKFFCSNLKDPISVVLFHKPTV